MPAPNSFERDEHKDLLGAIVEAVHTYGKDTVVPASVDRECERELEKEIEREEEEELAVPPTSPRAETDWDWSVFKSSFDRLLEESKALSLQQCLQQTPEWDGARLNWPADRVFLTLNFRRSCNLVTDSGSQEQQDKKQADQKLSGAASREEEETQAGENKQHQSLRPFYLRAVDAVVCPNSQGHRDDDQRALLVSEREAEYLLRHVLWLSGLSDAKQMQNKLVFLYQGSPGKDTAPPTPSLRVALQLFNGDTVFTERARRHLKQFLAVPSPSCVVRLPQWRGNLEECQQTADLKNAMRR